MFYSQEIDRKQTVDNVCARCEVRFHKWTDYHTHVTTVKCAKKFKPVNLSGRPSGVHRTGLEFAKEGTIVGDWERKNQGGFIQ